MPDIAMCVNSTFDSKARRDLMRRHGIEVLVLDDRIDFIHPERDLFAQDAKKGGAWNRMCERSR